MTLIAGQKISLLPTVSVEEYGSLHGWISTTGEYCFQATTPMVQVKDAGETSGDQAQKPDDWLVKIYPNPTTGTIRVKMQPDQPDEPVNITLRNLFGHHGSPADDKNQVTCCFTRSFSYL